jgi:hypothetical protein
LHRKHKALGSEKILNRKKENATNYTPVHENKLQIGFLLDKGKAYKISGLETAVMVL